MRGPMYAALVLTLLLLALHARDLYLARRAQLQLDDLDAWQRRQDRSDR